MSLIEFDHAVTAIDTGFTRPCFDASHLIEHDGQYAFVDTGTNFSVPHLLNALAAKDVATAQVRYILLTHVHLDHAGGAGELLRHLPNASVVIHPRGARHMVDPTRLIAGSQAVYGKARFARMYGDIVPIPEDRIVLSEDGQRISLAGRELLLVHTEGHARHHYCIIDEGAQIVFSGDTFGVSYRELDTAKGEFILPAATPTEFDPHAMHASIDRLMAYAPRAVFLTHYSRVTQIERLADDLHQDIDALVQLAMTAANAPDRSERLKHDVAEHYAERLREHQVDLDENHWRQMLSIDVELNAMGLDVWLSRRERAHRPLGTH